MNEPAINPYQAPSSQSLSAEVPKALGISQVELISYSTVALIQCVVATGLHTLWMKNPKSNMAKVLDDPWDWVVAGVAYCLLFIFLNLCVVKMRRVREGDHPGIDCAAFGADGRCRFCYLRIRHGVGKSTSGLLHVVAIGADVALLAMELDPIFLHIMNSE